MGDIDLTRTLPGHSGACQDPCTPIDRLRT